MQRDPVHTRIAASSEMPWPSRNLRASVRAVDLEALSERPILLGQSPRSWNIAPT